MDGNDTYGDCTIAGRAHCDTIWAAFDRKKHVWSAQTCLRVYFRLTGGVDSGLNVLTVMKDWYNNTQPLDDVIAYVSIDPQNHTHMQQAIALFGCIFVGFQCQQAIITDFNEGKPWTPGPLINEGHAVAFTGYTGSRPTDLLNVLTWGSAKQQGEWAWWDEVSGAGRGEAYAAVPKIAQTDPNFAPGFNIQQLLADLQDVHG